MKRIKLILAGLAVAVPLLGVAAVAHAQSFQTGDSITVGQNETVNQTLVATGRAIDIAGTVNGDVFCAGQTVTITGTVNGDVMCAGQDVHISGRVDGSVRVVGQSVTMSGLISHNLTAAGQNVSIESNGKVLGDVMIGGQDTTVNGMVGRDLAAGSTNVIVNGEVGRDIQTQGLNLTLGDTAMVGGNISYVSTKSLSQAPGAHVAGTVTRAEPARRTQRVELGAVIRGGFWFMVYLFFALLSVAILLALIMPQTFQMVTETAMRSPLKTVLIGLAGSIVAPIVICVLMFTVLGIPFSFVVMAAWVLALALAGPFAAYYFGRLLWLLAAGKAGDNALLIMLVGAIALLVLYFIPFIGFVTTLVALWFGLGMLLLQIPKLPRPRYFVAKR